MLIIKMYFIPMSAAALIALVTAGLLLIIFHRKDFRTDRKGMLRLFLVRFFGIWYAIAMIVLLMKPNFLFDLPLMNVFRQLGPFAAVSIVPFVTIIEYIGSGNWVQIFGNMLVLFPLPLLLRFNFAKMKDKSFRLTLLCVTVLIEPVQLLINLIVGAPINVIDIDDFLLNAAGCLLGLLGLKLFERRRRHFR